MFERYTETARRTIFFARYEASAFGSSQIGSEHLLLGVLREDKALANRFLQSHGAVESIRRKIEENSPIRAKVSTSVDLPLSHESKRALAYGAEESERLNHKLLGTEHLLLGLLREEKCFAAQLLREHGVTLELVREQVQPSRLASAQDRSVSITGLSHWFVDREAEASGPLRKGTPPPTQSAAEPPTSPFTLRSRRKRKSRKKTVKTTIWVLPQRSRKLRNASTCS